MKIDKQTAKYAGLVVAAVMAVHFVLFAFYLGSGLNEKEESYQYLDMSHRSQSATRY